MPILQQAVDALESSGDEQTYNYALFNLAHALRLSGRPDEAIPLLEQRLQYPDQRETVAAELERRARRRPVERTAQLASRACCWSASGRSGHSMSSSPARAGRALGLD